MQGGRGRGNPVFGFGDPFADFGGLPSLFGGRDPFEDPFFTRPFGGVFRSGLAGSPFMNMNPFGSSLFGPRANPFIDSQAPRVHENRLSVPNSPRGPIIEELNSDDEKDQSNAEDSEKENPRSHSRHEMQPYIELPDDEFEGREQRQTQFGDMFSMMNNMPSRPQANSFTFQSSTVTYGGSNGAYYTSSSTKRTGSDGLRFEEYKEADSMTGQAAHRLSRGIHDKGHTVTRNLKSDGRVDAMQVLHNINEGELGGFEEAWKGEARKQHLPGWTGGVSTHEVMGGPRRGGWALPSPEQSGQDLQNHRSTSGSHLGVRRRPDGGKDGQLPKIRRF